MVLVGLYTVSPVLRGLIEVLLSKRDIDAAFKRVLLSLLDIDLFASDLPMHEMLERALGEADPGEIAAILQVASLLDDSLDGLDWREAWLRVCLTPCGGLKVVRPRP